MNKLLIGLIFLLKFGNVYAHNPNTTSVVISPVNGVWIAQFTISQVGANYALNEFYADKDLQNVSLETYKELYVDYVKKHFLLEIDGKEIALNSGGIKLGGHQTNIKFLIPDFPVDFNDVKLKLNLFEENKDQNTAVKFTSEQKHLRQVLNHKKGFLVEFENTSEAFVKKVHPKQRPINFILVLCVTTGSILLIAWFIYGRKKQSS